MFFIKNLGYGTKKCGKIEFAQCEPVGLSLSGYQEELINRLVQKNIKSYVFSKRRY